MAIATHPRTTRSLLKLAASLSQVSESQVQSAAQAVLAGSAWTELRPAHSALNNDGSPLQLCIASKAHRWGVRLIGDPAYTVGSPLQRFRSGQRALQEILQTSGLAGLGGLFSDLLNQTLPQTSNGLDGLEVGGLWLATALGSPGVAAYTTAWWGDKTSRWGRSLAWLHGLLPQGEPASSVVERLQAVADLSSTALEGASLETARAKLYFRFSQPARLSEFGMALFAAPELAHFLETAIQSRALPLSGLVMSVGFAVATGDITDVKIDLCGCDRCLHRSPEAWLQLFDRLGSTYGLAIPPLEKALMEQQVSVAFIGMGITQRQQPRLNIYLKDNPQP